MKIALPAIVENLLQMLMGVVDNYLVAQLGVLAISGVAVANNILAVYQALFIALAAAISSRLASQQLTRASIRQALSLTFWLSTCLGLISMLFSSQLLGLLGAEKNLSDLGGLYLAIVGGGSFSLAYLTSLGAILRVKGKVQLPAYVSLLTNLLNAILSALSVFIFDFGVVGVAISTVLSRLIGCVILFFFAKLDLAVLIPELRVSRDFLAQALPIAGERLMMRLGDVVIVAIVVMLGTKAVAGNAIGETLTQFNYMPGLGLATATVILVAKAKKEEDRSKLKILIKEAYLLSSLLMATISGLVWLCGTPLSAAFSQDSAVQSYSSVVLLFSFLGTLATSGTLIYTAVFQGLGKAKLPFYATSIGMWGIRIGLGYLLALPLGLGLAGVWLATIADNIWRFAFLYLKSKTLKKST
ncbi:putative MATE family efflux protein [Streptococcus porcorum]|uniref:Probable multidrug resistance protein NorM n=2 Tax=Streptococcus porcorum TaxID=701526 RepID=A0ABV2JGI0_9STRE